MLIAGNREDHDADCPDHEGDVERQGRRVLGLRQLHADDHALLQHGVEMFEALARGILTT